MRSLRLTGLVVFLAVACSGRSFESATLGVRWRKLPPGVSLQSERPGPPAVASFSRGIELRMVTAEPPALEDCTLEATFAEVAKAAGLPSFGKELTSKVGSLPMGPCARYSFKDVAERSLVYVIAPSNAHRYWVVSLRAPESSYGGLEAQLEPSLASLEAK